MIQPAPQFSNETTFDSEQSGNEDISLPLLDFVGIVRYAPIPF
jgi:hypothetical protein